MSRHRRGTDEEDVRPEVEDLEAWFEPGAWLKQYILLLYRTLNAIQQFRLERLSALVEAACHFEES